MNLDWSILDKAKSYSPVSRKWTLCLTEKYHIIFSTKNLFNKYNEQGTKGRNENSIQKRHGEMVFERKKYSLYNTFHPKVSSVELKQCKTNCI